ncbi:MAG: acyl-CoA thioesterase [Gammaproteobacteria bacterium]|nr:acyl-CoA thioesterase [Gammaproteobacteria bacterium]
MTDALPPADQAHAACRKLLAAYPVIFEQPVSWGELDALGHVNNIIYFRYFENARMAYFEKIGFSQLLAETGTGPILAETQCRFRAALEHPDYVATGARVVKIDDDRFRMEYAVAGYSAGRIVAEGSGLIVCYDYNARRKTPLPARITQRINDLESTV